VSKHDRLYHCARWKALRRQQLLHCPLCEACMAHGHIIAAAVVDHVVPHHGDLVLFWDTANLQSLCIPCHNRDKKTIESLGYDPRAIGDDGWPLDPLHPANKKNNIQNQKVGGELKAQIPRGPNRDAPLAKELMPKTGWGTAK
jgi:5-methylcytosine-specific restriction enzyme A